MRPVRRCSTRRSAPTSSAPSRRTATARRWSRSATGHRWTYAELNKDVDALARGLIAAGIDEGRPGRDLGAQLRRVDDDPVRDRQGRRHPGEHQPGVPHPRARLRPQPVGGEAADLRDQLQDQRLPRHGRRGASAETQVEQRGLHRHAGVARAGRDGTAIGDTSASGWRRSTRTTRSTSSTRAARRASRRARRSATATSSTTATSRPRRSTSPSRTGSAIPVPFYHCFGMVMGNLGCTSHGATMVIPAPGFDPVDHAADHPGRALHRRVRRTDDVHRDAERTRASRTTTSPRCAPASWPARRARSR